MWKSTEFDEIIFCCYPHILKKTLKILFFEIFFVYLQKNKLWEKY